MNKKLIEYIKHLEDEILENNNRAYAHERIMKEYKKKSKEAEEILDLLSIGKKYKLNSINRKR